MPQKKSFEEVNNLFIQNNMELLESIYISSSIPMNYKCKKCNHIGKINYNNLQRGRNCPNCYGNVKKTFEEVQNLFNKNGMVLLEKEYKNAHTSMKYKCKKCNYIGDKSYTNLQRGKNCPKCSGNLKKSFKEVKDFFKQNNMELLENKYINAQTLMKYKCNICNYIGVKRYNDLQQGYRCPDCYYLNNIGENHPNYKQDRSQITLLKALRHKSNRFQTACRNLILKDNIDLKLYKNRYNWSINDMKIFIEKYNYIKNECFQVDHIIPLSSLLIENIIQSEKDMTNKLIKHINNINNFQLLIENKNQKKSNNYLKEDFDEFMINYFQQEYQYV